MEEKTESTQKILVLATLYQLFPVFMLFIHKAKHRVGSPPGRRGTLATPQLACRADPIDTLLRAPLRTTTGQARSWLTPTI
jgi:hypothetical protein